MHSKDALQAGETTRRLFALGAWRDTPFFSDRERAALGWTEAVTQVAEGHVPDDAWGALRPQFTPEEIADLTLLVTTVNAWNRFAIAFRKQPA